MKTFTYIATDKTGSRQTGVLQAQSIAIVRETLATQGLRVISITEGIPEIPERSTAAKHLAGPLIGRVRSETILTFFRQLGSMHKAGVPLVQSLDSISRQTNSSKMRQIILDLKRYVLSGQPLSAGMEQYPEVFTPLHLSIVKAGEEGGVLEKSLYQLSDYMAREVKLRNEIKARTFYPKFVLAFSVILVITVNFILTALIGEERSKQFLLQNPLLESSTLIVFIPAVIVLFMLFTFGPRIPTVKKVLDRIYLWIPYFGSTIRMLCMAKFGRAFASLYSAGVPIANAIRLSANACGNSIISEKIYPTSWRIQEGQSIADSFAKTGAFTPMAIDMAYTGEHTGNLDSMFENVAEHYEEEAEVRLAKSCHVLTIVILVIAAIFVFFMVYTFFMQYLSVLQSIDE